MRHLMRIVVLLICYSLCACGGGGGSSSESGGVLSIETDGPGDTQKYFPLTDGDTWTFNITTLETGKEAITSTGTMMVTGSDTIDGYETKIITFSGDSSGKEYYLKNGAGVYYFGDDTASTIDKAIPPYKIFRFPVLLDDTFVQLDTRKLDLGEDLDGDGRNENVAIRSEVRVTGFETLIVAAGTFVNCARVETSTSETIYLSRNGAQVVATLNSIDWYAPSAGPVKKHRELSLLGHSVVDDFSLVSYSVAGYKSDSIQPAVVSMQPVTSSTVSSSTPIRAVFSEEMDPLSLNGSTFIVTDDLSNPVSGTITYANKTATFVPTSRMPTGRYTATISSLAQDLAGNRLISNYVWSFNFDATTPTVVSTTPIMDATNVFPSAPISATFNEIVVNSYDGFKLKDAYNRPIAGHISYNDKTVTFTPDAPLVRDSTYTATLTTAIRDSLGNTLSSDYSWSFTTASGRFLPYVTQQTGSSPTSVAIGDVNGDGRNDVALITSYRADTENDNKLFIFVQNSAGGLDPPIKYSTGGSVRTVVIGDMNHDGKNDVVIGGLNQIQIFLQNSSGGLTPSALYPSADAYKIRIADINKDGLSDIAGIGSASGTVSIWLQNGGGTLNSPVSYAHGYTSAVDLELGDVNNDGTCDIVVMRNQSADVHVLTQLPDGTFNLPVLYSTVRAGQSGMVAYDAAIGDVNGDSLNDVILAGWGLTVLPQNSSGILVPFQAYATYATAWPVEIADMDNDGRNDVIVLYGGLNTLGILLQNTDGTMLGQELYPLPYLSYSPTYSLFGFAVGDINNDGLKDAVIADPDNGLVVLYAKSTSVLPKTSAKSATTSENISIAPFLKLLKKRRY